MKSLVLKEGTIQFPKEYEPKKYELNNEVLSPLAEEMLWAWSTLADKYATDKVYQKNFYSCLKSELTLEQKKLKFPTDFQSLLDVMATDKKKESDKKKEYNKEHRKEIAEQKALWKETYGYALVDGEKVELSNTMIEAPHILISRGLSKEGGNWVYRVTPEDISINCSENYPCPIPNHNWKEVSFKDSMSIATYVETVGNIKKTNKAIWFSSKSEFKADSDMEKFEKARLLQLNIKKVNKAIENACLSVDHRTKQIGTCAYLISVFGIRAGNPNEKENGVVGASTLLVENVSLNTDTREVTLDFIGKDSIHFKDTKKVSDIAFDCILYCGKNKTKKERIFDLITSNDVNEFLQNILPKILPSLSCKTFRSAIGCGLLASEIQKQNWEGLNDKEFQTLYNKCVLTVAKKLNHQKTVTKEQSTKIDSSVKERLKKSKDSLKTKKENTELKLKKLANEKVKCKLRYSGKTLKDKLAEIRNKEKDLKEKLAMAELKYKDLKEELTFKKDNKGTALNTSKLNYSNPKIAYSLCKCYEKDPQLIYSKTVVERFDTWAKDVDTDYWRNYPNVN